MLCQAPNAMVVREARDVRRKVGLRGEREREREREREVAPSRRIRVAAGVVDRGRRTGGLGQLVGAAAINGSRRPRLSRRRKGRGQIDGLVVSQWYARP